MNANEQHVLTVVDKVFPFGVFVTIQDGRRGYIRRRELSWEGDLDPRDLVRPGQRLTAVQLNLDDVTETIELSHRALLPDPWVEFARTHRIGDSVTGTVKQLGPELIWVEIKPGIHGSMPVEELSATPLDRPEEMVWEGDHVAAVITSVNGEKRTLRLSMRRRLSQLALVNSVLKNIAEPGSVGVERVSSNVELPTSNVEQRTLTPNEIARIGRVLVVEDKEELRASLMKWLAARGIEVTGVGSIDAALVALEESDWGLCLIDIGLGAQDGLTLVREVQRLNARSCVAVMSTPQWLDKRSSEISDLGIGAALAKPLDRAELLGLLGALADGRCPQMTFKDSTDAPGPPILLKPVHSDNEADFKSRLQETLDSSLIAIQAEQVVLFEMALPQKTVSIVAAAGRLQLNEDALYLLPHSPVEDVISEMGSAMTDAVSAETTRRFEKLQPLVPFESCMGVPVASASGVRHALFYFHRRPNAFNMYRQRDAMATATLLAAHLERQAFDEQLLLSEELLLSGRLASAFGHEIHNKMSTVELQGVNLQHDLEQVIAGGKPAGNDLVELRAELDSLVSSTMSLRETVRRFQDLMRAEEQWELSVNEAVRGAKAQLQTVLEQQQITVQFDLAPGMPLVPGNSQRLHYVLLNLLLNAIQHLEKKPARERRIELTSCYEPQQPRRPVRLRIADSGPGIHRQLWERIFQLGFSTRPQGTGLGLYIARSLVENMGGSISIERSVIGIGTTFLLAFPEA